MKTTLANLISCLCFSFLLLNSALAEGSFEHNEGQLQYFDGTPASEILFYQQGNYDVYFKKTGISYIYKSKSSVNVTDKKAYEAFLNDSTFYYRLDLNFKGSNVDRLIGDHPKSDYTNYYSANAPDGILNVKSYEKILYENLYPNIDAVFYFKDGKLKYDFHVKPGGAIEDIQLEFVNEDDLEVVENQIIINTPLGAVKESIPVSFQFEGRKQKNVPVLYKKTKDIIQFAAEYDRSKELIIDPEIEWQTFYDGAWGVGTANRIDTRGDQFVMTFYSFKTGVPILNPGNGAYFQNTNAGSGDIVIVQFDTMGVRQWATYYGGSDYENTSDIEIDSKGRLVVSFVTESTDIPVENAGGYFDPSWTAGQFNWSSAFVIRFDKNGVRQWATHYDHFQYPQVQIDSDDNIWLAGQCQYDNPSTQSAPGAYLQTTIVPKASFNEGSGDYFICKFDSLTNRTWATILGGNCREMLGDFVIDNNDNAYLLGGGDNYYGTTFVTQNAGGYFDGALGQGTGGTSADRGDILIHKFSQNGALLWGTAFGGSGFEWAWPAASSISFDQNGNVYIASPTRSSDLPFVDLGNGAHYDNVFSNPTGSSNPSNHFIARFSPSTSLQWCTYWGQRSFEYSTWHGIELEFNSQNRLVLAVGAYSGGPHYPIVNRTGDYNASNNGNTNDVHIAEFDQNFAVDWATYYGGNADERLGDMVLSENGYSIFMTGTRPNFSGNTGVNWVLPLNNSIYFDSTWANSSSASGSSELITKFSNHNLCDPVFLTAAAASICESDSVLLTPNIGGGTYNILNGGGTIVGNYYFPANVSSTTTVSIEYALNSSPFCTDSKDTVDLTVFADPSLATIFNDTVCFGDTAILTILSPSGVTHNWYTGSVGGTPFHTGTSYQINGATIPSTFYIENVNSNGCKSDRVPVQVVINANPINPTTVNDTVCSGDSATLLVTNPSGVAFDWFSNPTGGTSLHVGGSLVINPANTSTTYYVESVTKDGCVSPGRTSVELVVNSRPNDPVGLNDTVCSGDNATLTLTSPAGVSFDWYTSQNGTSIVHTGSSLSINPATSSTSYYVESVNNSDCPSVNRIKLDLVVLALPQNVTALNDTVCSGDSATLIATNPNNVTFSWYANASGGTALGTGTNYVINPATANGTYYVEALNNSNCKSANRTPVQLVVLSTPTAPSTIDDTVCAGQSATLGINTSVGISYDWYDASSSGNLVNTGINYNINPATVSDTFYVNAVSNFGCGSASRSPVYLVVNALPQAPSGMGDTVCSGDTANLFATAPTGVTFDWYDNTSGGVLVNSGTQYQITPALSTDTFYLESVSNQNCRSAARVPVYLVVNPLPQNVSALNDTVCSGDSATLIATNPNNVAFSWYANASGGTALGTGTNYVINPATANGTYYVEALNNSNCKSAGRTPVQLVVLSTPTAPSTIDDTVCAGQSATLGVNTSVGISYDWYDASSSGNLVNTGINYNINPATVSDTFYVNAVSNFGCGSASRSPVYLVVNALPQAPSGMGDTVCSGDTANLFATAPTGVTFDWYDNTSGGVLVNSGTQYQIIPALSTDTFYLESVSNQNCKSAGRVPVYLVVNPLPQNVTALNDTVCSGDSATLIATNPNNVTFSWYANASGGTALGTGTNYVINPATANGTYYVEALNNSNCKSASRTPVQLVVLSTPTAPSTIDDTVCAGQSATLGVNTSVGISYDWYDASSSGNLVNTGINYNINPATVSDTFYVNAVSNFGCGSASRSPVYLVVNALPQAPSGMGDTVCSGDTANLFATAPTGVTFDWYDNTSGGVLVNSGTQYQITPALSTDTFYLESVSNQNCKSAVRIPVYLVVNPLPAQPTALGDTVCVGDTATLLATSPSGVTFVWYASSTGGIALDSGFQFGIDSALINTTYWVEAINTTNCKNTNRTPVDLVVQPAPTNPQANGDLVCFGDVGTLTATAPNNVVFNWYADASGNNYLNSGINYDVIPAVVTDTFYLEAVSSIGCGSTALIPVIIQVSQLPSLTVINTNDLSCNGSADGVAEVLATGGAPNYVYQWGPTSNLQSGATATALNAGIHTVIVTDSLGCKDTLDVSLNEPQAIQANISPENAHCNEGGSATVTVSAGGTAPFNYLWSDPLSQTASTATGLTASSFSVTITDFNGCQTMQSVVIDDTSAVFAEIDADPLQGFNPITVDFTSLSTGAITDYLWEFADGNSSVEMDPSHTYDAYGDFMVHLTVSNGYCKDVDSILIKVNASSQIFIPNVFSPNGDGMNDKFMPEFIGIEEVNVRVFNRWGHLMTEWNNLEKGSWDGRMSSGNWASEGTYYYFIKARGFDGEIFEETGSLNLVK